MTAIAMTVGGERVAGTSSFDVIDPATGEVSDRAPVCEPAVLDAAFAAARSAAGPWSADEDGRRAALRTAADAVAGARDELATLLSTEQGKPVKAAAYEVDQHALWLRTAADLSLAPQTLQDDDRAAAELVRRPLGVVAAITPWNYPVLLAGWKLGPALVAGNTVVLKPSPYTPLATLRIGELLSDVLPAGVLNVVSGPDPLGSAMTRHPQVDKITFTGSVATGKAVAAAAADDIKRVTLELGGNDAAIVLEDADPAAIARSIFWGAFTNCGQICAGIKRLFVPGVLFGEMVDALAQLANRVRVGAASDERSQIGPVQNAMQFKRVCELVDEAVRKGAKPAAGAAPLGRSGYFYPPTVLTDVTEGMRVVDEEQFGPVLPVLRYSGLDEAIDRANATTYGLSGSVWSPDTDRAEAVARRLTCGTAFVNDHLTVGPHLPFGGWRHSGLGVENGPWGLDAFTQLQVVYRKR
jgi:acyl-CoA reductase-like NAD-dependent aldehyde dehydrogenase